MRSACAARLRSELLECDREGLLEQVTATLTAAELNFLKTDWGLWARDDQMPPQCGWTTWLALGGRGAGKTRAGAEWVRAQALERGAGEHMRIALVGETLTDVRSIMIEGVSGLLAVHADHERPCYEPSKRKVTWRNGAVAQIYSADDPDSLRGPQFSHAWLDELAKYPHPERLWDMLQFALRLGRRPRQVVTTTPRPIPLLKQLLEDSNAVVSRAATAVNAANLAPTFLESIVGRYRGTRLGRQELDAEILEDRPDSLWPRVIVERARVGQPPALNRIVVAVDPPVTSGKHSDACGIVVAGRGEDSRAYVLADVTIERAGPLAWARAAVQTYHRFGADRIVAEVNQGGDLVDSVIRQVEPEIPVRKVRATRGKWLRAEPVAALYEQGRVAHVGAFPELEDQMADFGRDGLSGGASPDRVDALVWALTELMLQGGVSPRVRTL